MLRNPRCPHCSGCLVEARDLAESSASGCTASGQCSHGRSDIWWSLYGKCKTDDKLHMNGQRAQLRSLMNTIPGISIGAEDETVGIGFGVSTRTRAPAASAKHFFPVLVMDPSTSRPVSACLAWRDIEILKEKFSLQVSQQPGTMVLLILSAWQEREILDLRGIFRCAPFGSLNAMSINASWDPDLSGSYSPLVLAAWSVAEATTAIHSLGMSREPLHGQLKSSRHQKVALLFENGQSSLAEVWIGAECFRSDIRARRRYGRLPFRSRKASTDNDGAGSQQCD